MFYYSPSFPSAGRERGAFPRRLRPLTNGEWSATHSRSFFVFSWIGWFLT